MKVNSRCIIGTGRMLAPARLRVWVDYQTTAIYCFLYLYIAEDHPNLHYACTKAFRGTFTVRDEISKAGEGRHTRTPAPFSSKTSIRMSLSSTRTLSSGANSDTVPFSEVSISTAYSPGNIPGSVEHLSHALICLTPFSLGIAEYAMRLLVDLILLLASSPCQVLFQSPSRFDSLRSRQLDLRFANFPCYTQRPTTEAS